MLNEIDSLQSGMTRAEKKVARVVLASPYRVLRKSIAVVAREDKPPALIVLLDAVHSIARDFRNSNLTSHRISRPEHISACRDCRSTKLRPI